MQERRETPSTPKVTNPSAGGKLEIAKNSSNASREEIFDLHYTGKNLTLISFLLITSKEVKVARIRDTEIRSIFINKASKITKANNLYTASMHAQKGTDWKQNKGSRLNIKFSERNTEKIYKKSVMQMANMGKAIHNAIMTEITPG